MTTHTDLGIGEATWAASLRAISHPWHPGQRCYRCEKQIIVGETIGGNDIWAHVEHDILAPAVTDELLIRILKVALLRKDGGPQFLDGIAREYWNLLPRATDDQDEFTLFVAAIIRATAALELI